MKRFTIPLLVPLLSVGCGSSATSPSATAIPAPSSLQIILALLNSPDSPQGLGSPMNLTFRVGIASGEGGTVEAATVKVADVAGETLVEQLLAPGTPIPAGGFGQFQTLLTWSMELGYGKRLDASVRVRDAYGRIITSSLSFAVK